MEFKEEEVKEVNGRLEDIFKEEIKNVIKNPKFINKMDGVEPFTILEKISVNKAEEYLKEEDLKNKYNCNGAEAYIRYIANVAAEHIKQYLGDRSLSLYLYNLNFEIYEEEVEQIDDIEEPHKPFNDINYIESVDNKTIFEYLDITAYIKARSEG